MKFGLQLYTFRKELAADFDGTMQKIAQLGFDGVEVVTYRGPKSPAEYAQYLKDLNLECCGTMYEPAKISDPADEAYDYIKAIKSPAVTISCWSENFTEEWQEQAAIINSVAQAAKTHGIPFSYHNHWLECVKIGDTTALDKMLEAAQDNVWVEPDVCWLNRGGINPAEFIGKYARRIKQVHFKDILIADDIKTTAALGTGVVDLKGAFAAAEAAGVDWIIYEQDTTSDAFEDARKSLDFLKSL